MAGDGHPGGPGTVTSVGRSPFDPVAADYDAGRPSYPDGVFPRSSGPPGTLRGALVLDVGAGTGIATRQLAARGARTVAIDFGEIMLRRARDRSPGLTYLQADGNTLPIRSGSVDLTCFAQSWHWFDQHRASWEVARVLRPGGSWAAWWSHAWADGQSWFDTYQEVMEAACPGYRRHHRDPDWSEEGIAGTGLFEPGLRIVVPWTRQVEVGTWMAEERSKSYIAQLAPPVRGPAAGPDRGAAGHALPRDPDDRAVPDPDVAGPAALISAGILDARVPHARVRPPGVLQARVVTQEAQQRRVPVQQPGQLRPAQLSSEPGSSRPVRAGQPGRPRSPRSSR